MDMINKLEKIKENIEAYNNNEHKTNYRANNIVKQCFQLFKEVSEQKATKINDDNQFKYVFLHFTDQFRKMAEVLNDNSDYVPPEIDFNGIISFIEQVDKL